MSSLVIALALSGLARTAPDPAILAKAGALLSRSDEILAAAPALKAKYTETDTYTGEYKDLRQEATVELARPDELRIAITRSRHVRAGEPWKDTGNNTLTVIGPDGQTDVFFHPHSTQVRSAPSGAAARSLQEAPLLSGFFSGKNSPASLLNKAQADGTLDNVEVDGQKVRFTSAQSDQIAEIGPDGVVHKLSVTNRDTGATRTWTLDSLTLGAEVDKSTFRYSAPADAIPFDRFPKGEGLPAGSAAPGFQLSDSAGNPVRLSDLKGKPVVLKFWATWCWPCNQSLPETEALAEKYRDQGVTVYAIAIKDSKAGFDAWLKKHPQYKEIRFLFEDPKHPTVSTAYKVRTTPTVYVVDRNGQIQSEIDGFAGPNPALEGAIQGSLK